MSLQSAQCTVSVDSWPSTQSGTGHLVTTSADDPESTTYVELELTSIEDLSDADAAPAASAAAMVSDAQSLEEAANRAELARQQRAHQELQRTLRLRDEWLQNLRDELKSTQNERDSLAGQLLQFQAQLAQLTEVVAQKDILITSLQSDIARRAQRVKSALESLPQPALERPVTQPFPVLEPIGYDSPRIVLDRKAMTLGRTADSDICVPSLLVSRDHARLLVGEDGVTIVDLGSSNGCFVNDQPVRKKVLHEGDVVRIADRCFLFTEASAVRLQPAAG